MAYHEPVLGKTCIEALAIRKAGIYVDATFGGGGHSKMMMRELGQAGRLYAFDQDDDSLANLIEDRRFVFNHHNFRYMQRFLKLHGVEKVDGILADLGVSSHQFDKAERGFSYRFEAELDMRMNRSDEKTASSILNNYQAEELQHIFSRYGEVRNSKILAQAVVRNRAVKPFVTIGDFLTVLEPLVRGAKHRYLAQVFQALRIEVNDEMGALKDFLEQAFHLLTPGGRLVVISYHSLEDRMVKNFLKAGNVEGEIKSDFFGRIEKPFTLIYKGVVTPGKEEIAANSRARSAKLRAGIKNE